VSRALGERGDAPVSAMHFTRDARRLVTAGDAGFTVWDARRPTPLATVGPLAGTVRQFTLSADGRTAYSAGEDGSVIAWDLTGGRGMGRPFRVGSRPPLELAAVSATGAAFAVASERGDVEIVDSRTLARTGRIPAASAPGTGGRATATAIAPDRRTLAIGTADGAVRFVDVRARRPLGPPEIAHVGAVLAMAFSADGRRLVTGGNDHALYVWDVRRRTPAGPPYIGLVARPTSVSVSPDGTTVTATIMHEDGNGEVNILRLPRLELVAQKPAAPGAQTQFSRDGRRLFYGDDTGQVWTLDTRTWRPLGPPLGPGRGGRFALSPDEAMLATTGTDGSTQLWDVASGRPIGSPLQGTGGGAAHAAFLDGGTGLVTIGRDGHGTLWDLRLESWARRACAVAGRTLSHREWRDALPERDYAPACGHP
jgi:WD40 repeat protein